MLEEHEENRRISGNMSEVFFLIISDVVNIDLQICGDTGSARYL